MGVDDDDIDYGFARRGDPERKKVGRRSAVPAGPPPSKKQGSPHPPVLSGDRAPLSQKPAWVWLLIGFLLGTGGTLTTSSFWLPQGDNSGIAALDAGDDLTSAPTEAKAATLSPAPADERTPDGPRPAVPSPVAQASLTAEAASEALRNRAENADASDGAVKSASPKPAVTQVGRIDKERLANATEPSAALQTPESVLAALIAKREAAARPEANQASPPKPNPPAPTTTAATTLPTATSSNVAVPTPRVRPDPPSNTREAGPANAVDRADLPPRIRQALLAAEAETRSASEQDTSRGKRLYRVQLAAVDDEAQASLYWREVNERLPGVFADVKPIFDQRTVDERLYLRVWVGAFDNSGDANGYCAWLKEQGQDCFVTRVDGR